MPFSAKVKEDAFVACGRCCALCHKFCGIKIEVHHIQEEADGGDNSFDNAIPLCFDCHADMRSYDHKHPKGNKYSRTELSRHRDLWYKKVANGNGVAGAEEAIATDIQVYRLLVKVLPWNGSMSFISTNNFAGFSFSLSDLDQLNDYERLCKNPTFEFIDPDLESLRSELLSHIDKFTMTIATQTFPTNNSGRNSVPEEWEFEQPDRFREVVQVLHDTAHNAVETYSSLVRTGTRKLGILPPEIAEQGAQPDAFGAG